LGRSKHDIIDKNSQSTPYIIRATSFFIILSSAIAIIFYSYVLFFNYKLLSTNISVVINPFISINTYIILEYLLFILLILGAVLLLRLSKWGAIIISSALTLLFGLNYFYYSRIDYLNLVVFLIILLIMGFSAKKMR
jgi:hypothetical protein